MDRHYAKLMNKLLDQINKAKSTSLNLFVSGEEHILLHKNIEAKENTFMWRNPEGNYLGMLMGHKVFLYEPLKLEMRGDNDD